MRKIEAHLRTTGEVPLLQIEVHGDKEGIELSGEHLLWEDEQREIIKTINVDQLEALHTIYKITGRCLGCGATCHST